MIDRFRKRYCSNIEQVENYELAEKANFVGWVIHHRLEEFYTMQELKELGKYWDVPPEELIFLTQAEHKKHPHKSFQSGRWCHSDETRRKISEVQKGRKQSVDSNKKRSDSLKGIKRSPETIEKMRKAAQEREREKKREKNGLDVQRSIHKTKNHN